MHEITVRATLDGSVLNCSCGWCAGFGVVAPLSALNRAAGEHVSPDEHPSKVDCDHCGYEITEEQTNKFGVILDLGEEGETLRYHKTCWRHIEVAKARDRDRNRW